MKIIAYIRYEIAWWRWGWNRPSFHDAGYDHANRNIMLERYERDHPPPQPQDFGLPADTL